MYGSSTEYGDAPPDLSEEVLLPQCLMGSYFDTSRYAMEIFGEGYD